MNKFYLTTSIPYVNGDPHVGHLLEFIQTDCLARYHRLQGDQVFLLTGADENSLKNVQAAEAAGVPVADLVATNTQKFVNLAEAVGLTADSFIRTSSDLHIRGAQKLWQACDPSDIYRQTYEGHYCVGCESFKTPEELHDGKCPIHLTVPDIVAEDNYFFRLSRYQQQLDDLINSDRLLIVPTERKNEMLGFIRQGLQDFSISRSIQRAKGWGVPVPGDDQQVMYVWFDALSNYLTGLGYANDSDQFKQFWPADVHVIGKDIVRFHAIYWPAMLLSAGLPLPRRLFGHGFLTVDGQKMSKSLGNVINPFELIQSYGAESLRYFLLGAVSPFSDGDFSRSRLEQVYTSDLANGLGNLVSRSLSLAEKNCGGVVPAPTSTCPIAMFDWAVYHQALDGYEFDRATMMIRDWSALWDGYVEQTKPWELAKTNPDQLPIVIYNLLEGVRILAVALAPILPATATIIYQRLGYAHGPHAFGSEGEWGRLPGGQTVTKGEPLFPRLS